LIRRGRLLFLGGLSGAILVLVFWFGLAWFGVVVYVCCWVEGRVRGVGGSRWDGRVAYLDICAGFEDGVFANHDGG
jgi:hypothetical protein